MSFFRETFLTEDLRTAVEVQRGGGRDARGNPNGVEKLPVDQCQVTPLDASDPRLDRSDVPEDTALLYYDGPFVFESTDRIVVPVGQRMAGEWEVDGRPSEWPGTVELKLRRAA
jgi:hypothetical protein